MSGKPVIGITMGDAAGIGPEVIVKSLVMPQLYRQCHPVVIGSAAALREAARQCRLHCDIQEAPADGRLTGGDPRRILVIDDGALGEPPVAPGVLTARAGAAAVGYIRRATELALAGRIDGVATGPVNKQAIHAAGIDFTGQAEAFAFYSGSPGVRTMLSIGTFRLILVTTHVPLRAVSDLCTRERVLDTIRVADESMRRFGVDRPRIGVAALNPHMGDGGLMGDEEEKQIRPAVDWARAEGIEVAGPLPLPSAFVDARGGRYDMMVSMYHDQAVLALGSLDMVTTTLGMPFIRTSVGHGTAYEIAGEDRANPEPMLRSIELAADLTAAVQRARAR